MRTKAFIKLVTSCQICPHFCDEGEWCRHPARGVGHHVINDWRSLPDDCPLPDAPDAP